MNFVMLAWFFILGMVFGSFYGVVGSRLPEKKSIVKPRSHCPYCKHVLKWYELIPVFSYIIQNGKCRNCKKNISVFYPLVEIITGLLFSISYFYYGFSKELFIALLIASFLVIVIVSDVNYLIIPDEVTLFFSIVMIIIKLICYGIKNTVFSIMSGALMFCLMYCIMILASKIFKKDALGGADIKLMFFTGLVLSPTLAMFDIFLSSLLALPISIVFLIKDKNNVIPYGPFILIGVFLIYFFS